MSSSYDSALVDTAMIEDARLLSLPRGVRLVHIEAMVWAKLRRTDGYIPAGGLTRLTDEPNPLQAASELVRVGLWESAPAGWQIVGFTDMQMSADRVRQKQAAAKERYDTWTQKQKQVKRVGNDVANGPARPPALPASKGRRQVGGANAAGQVAAAAAPPVGTVHVECADYTSHQLHHRRTSSGWGCDLCQRRELARAIREAASDSDRRRFGRTFNRTFGHVYGRAST